MIKVITAWSRGNARHFESHVPLLWSGLRNQSLGSSNDIHVVFLEGFDKLGNSYLDQLTAVGYQLHDASSVHREKHRVYSNLARFGSYELNCFLRWPIIEELFAGEPIAHFDGDIVFNVAPEALTQRLADTTFVLQGCPALTCVSKKTWWDAFREELALFNRDIRGYSEAAWCERVGWEDSHRLKWAGSRFRKVISSDQDLISHLIHTDRLPQTDPLQILERTNGFILCENPLWWFSQAAGELANTFEWPAYSRIDGVDTVGRQRFAFWHMQGDVCEYLRKLVWLTDALRLRTRIHRSNERSVLHYQSLLTSAIKYLPLPHKHFPKTRLEICQWYFEREDFRKFFDPKIFWKDLTSIRS